MAIEPTAAPGVPVPAPAPSSVFIYELPVRIWHWTTAICILTLMVTGYLIGSPPPSVGGEAYNTFVFGYIRTAHFIAGYTFAAFLVLRTWWALVGNKHARQIFTLPMLDAKFRKDLVWQLRWYAFLAKEPKKHVGHNPLARLTMFSVFVLCAFVLAITGLALYSEGAGIDSWQYAAFGWVLRLAGSSQAVHTLHHAAMWVMVVFVMAHIYAVIREDIMGRSSILSTMISGWRNFRDTRD